MMKLYEAFLYILQFHLVTEAGGSSGDSVSVELDLCVRVFCIFNKTDGAAVSLICFTLVIFRSMYLLSSSSYSLFNVLISSFYTDKVKY